jgi:hypothetical protein
LLAGSFVYVPRRETHVFGNAGADEARVLAIATPGAVQSVEDVFEVMDAPNGPDLAGLTALYARHASEIAGPLS